MAKSYKDVNEDEEWNFDFTELLEFGVSKPISRFKNSSFHSVGMHSQLVRSNINIASYTNGHISYW